MMSTRLQLVRLCASLSLAVGAITAIASAADFKTAETDVQWERIQFTDTFYSEGAHFGDITGNGEMDIVSGPYWWEGPDYENRYEYYPAEAIDPAGYSEHFFTFTHDFTGNGYDDVLVFGFPGAEARWYENPGPDGHDEHWPRHDVYYGVDNESPDFRDITGDGLPEIICSTGGAFGFVRVNWDNPREQWSFHAISPEGPAGGQFTHGLGIGDVNGNGLMDLLEKNGWWEQPQDWDGESHWTFHEYQFTEPGGAQMYAYDVNGNGRNDVITSLAGHAWGLAWFENVEDDNGNITFVRHDIMTDNPDDNPYGVAFSQLHAVELVDINGNGKKDIITGKRWWAHSGNDPGADDPSVLYWFELTRDDDGNVEWVPHQIDDDSGVGTQVVVGDVSGNDRPDIVVGNKRGTFVHLQR